MKNMSYNVLFMVRKEVFDEFFRRKRTFAVFVMKRAEKGSFSRSSSFDRSPKSERKTKQLIFFFRSDIIECMDTKASRTVSAEQKAPKVVKRPHKTGALYRFFHGLTHYNTGTRPRVWELDLFRGALMLFVTLDHVVNFGFQLGFFDFKTPAMIWFADNVLRAYLNSSFRIGIQPFGLFIFSFLSGISCSLSGSSLKRTIKMVVLCGVYMGVFALLHVFFPTLVTSYFIFNIINVLTICVIFWDICDLIRMPTWLRTVIGLTIGAVGLTYYFSYFVRGVADIENDILALLVYNGHGMNLVQNFEPLFPHMGFFILGGVLGGMLYADRKTRSKSEVCILPLRPLAIMGKNSLVTYLFLPVIVLALIWVVEKFVWLFI